VTSTTGRGAEAMDNGYRLMDLTAYGRQEAWKKSPEGWPQQCSITRSAGGAVIGRLSPSGRQDVLLPNGPDSPRDAPTALAHAGVAVTACTCGSACSRKTQAR
jgi:hypothetical protein